MEGGTNPFLAAPTAASRGLEADGPFRERREAERRFRALCRAILAPGLLGPGPGPASAGGDRPLSPGLDPSTLPARVATARWACRAMGLPAVVFELAVPAALEANRGLLGLYERQLAALDLGEGGEGTPAKHHFVSGAGYRAWRQAEQLRLREIATALRGVPDYQASVQACVVAAHSVPYPPRPAGGGLGSLLRCCVGPEAGGGGKQVNAYAVVSVAPRAGQGLSRTAHCVGPGGVHPPGGHGFVTSVEVNSRDPEWHQAMPFPVVTTSKDDRLCIEVRHRHVVDGDAGEGGCTPKYRPDGRKVKDRVPNYSSVASIAQELGKGPASDLGSMALASGPTEADGGSVLLGRAHVTLAQSGGAASMARVETRLSAGGSARDLAGGGSGDTELPPPSLEVAVECLVELGQHPGYQSGGGPDPFGPLMSYRERTTAVASALGDMWRAWAANRGRRGEQESLAGSEPLPDSSLAGFRSRGMEEIVEAAYACASHVPTGTFLFVVVKLAEFLRVRAEAVMICLARTALGKWKVEAGFLVSLRRLLLPVARAMKNDMLNKVELQMAEELMVTLASRTVAVLDSLFSLLPPAPAQAPPCVKALVSLAGLALIQDPAPAGFDDALKVHVRRSARQQMLVVLGHQERSLEDAVRALASAAALAKDAVALDVIVAAAMTSSSAYSTIAMAASATRYSVLASALEQIFGSGEVPGPGYSAAVQALEDAMIALHSELRVRGMIKRIPKPASTALQGGKGGVKLDSVRPPDLGAGAAGRHDCPSTPVEEPPSTGLVVGRASPEKANEVSSRKDVADEGEIEVMDLETLFGPALRAWVGSVSVKLCTWVRNNIEADTFVPVGTERGQRYSVSLAELLQLLGTVTQQIMGRAVLGTAARRVEVAVLLERSVAAAFGAYAKNLKVRLPLS